VGTSKRWTNVTFTKRVDHEAGRRRGPTAAKGPRICQACGAVYVKRRWTFAQRIGHALHKALHGTVRYRFSHENKFAHVTWSRD
jgi:hypothetical protein